MQENSYRFFQNTACVYYPCHQGVGEDFNCLFCYCPLYALGDQCGGQFVYLPNGVKNCEHCTRPHDRNGYDYVMERVGQLIRMAARPLEEHGD
ncbi:MAG: cysteine-rich small domain-containing protein [Clostridia bacterium]|nr:cysteine-rich small domain-containing protein [Clostridia bacterium]